MNIVLAPGYMLDADLWTDIAPALEQTGTLHHADLSRDGDIGGMARRLLDDAPERFVLIGFSMGGYVARAATYLAPERVSALALIATSSRGDNEIQAQRKATAARTQDPSRFAGLSRAAIASSLASAHAGDEILIGRIREMSDRLGGETFVRQSNLVRVDDTHRLSEIRCPTLVIAAAEDRLRGPEEAQALHEGVRGSRLVTIAGSGHMIPLEAPEALLAVLLPWLAEVA